MPTLRRKPVLLTEPSEALLNQARANPNAQVYYLERTGEIFDSYEAYALRMSFYRLKQFQCEVTGKSNIDYFSALESEQQEGRTLHARFSEQLKPPVLKAVQWQVMGRLDHVVDAVYDRFKDRYFKGERVLVEVGGAKYHSRVEKVYPPRNRECATDVNHASSSSSNSSAQEENAVHIISGDLKVPAKEANAKDDPKLYYYWVQILEPEARDKSKLSAATKAANAARDESVVKSLMEVKCDVMSRDRLSFSKSILRRFIRDCVDRAPAIASPWIVKPQVAKRYGIESVMSEETRKGVENIKLGESAKRKKLFEDKEGPPNKKTKKEENKAKVMVEAAAKRDKAEAAEKQKQEKLEAERLEAEKKKKKPLRYPTEDLDIRLLDKDKKAGVKVMKPIPSKQAVPFHETKGTFEAFLLAWNFLVVYGHPLHISTFTMDEFEHAMRHSVAEPPCSILSEVHSTLIYNLRTVPFVRHTALLSLLRLKENEGSSPSEVYGVTLDQLTAAMADIGNNWERVPLRAAEGREGWEDALVGCLKDHANLENFPRLREVLTRLLFAPEPESDAPSPTSSGSQLSVPPTSQALSVPSTPIDRYHALLPEDRIAILSFMCNTAVSSKAIHTYMETCEEQLTALRKEKIEINRSKKQYTEEMNALIEETKEDKPANESANTNGGSGDVPMADLSDLSDEEVSKPRVSQRGLVRAKQASVKKALAEHRKLDEEVNKLERRLESIEREFRKLLGAVRVKALGRDRFFNRVWWFDGMGSASLVGSGGVVQYGTGRIFIQYPSEFDWETIEKRGEAKEVEERRLEEEGVEGMLKEGQWAVYSEQDEVDEFIAWLNIKGNRELALKNAFTKWWPHIAPGMRKRQSDLNVNAKLPEARRSARTRTMNGYDISREPYMMWTNRRAVNLNPS